MIQLLLVGILVVLLLKGLMELVLRLSRGKGRPTPVLEERVGGILMLVCTVVMVAIAFWYPWYVSTYHSAPDDRYGAAMMLGFPFWFIGPALAGRAWLRLMQAVVRHRRDAANIAFAVCGFLLALATFSPWFMILWRLRPK